MFERVKYTREKRIRCTLFERTRHVDDEGAEGVFFFFFFSFEAKEIGNMEILTWRGSGESNALKVHYRSVRRTEEGRSRGE